MFKFCIKIQKTQKTLTKIHWRFKRSKNVIETPSKKTHFYNHQLILFGVEWFIEFYFFFILNLAWDTQQKSPKHVIMIWKNFHFKTFSNLNSKFFFFLCSIFNGVNGLLLLLLLKFFLLEKLYMTMKKFSAVFFRFLVNSLYGLKK